MGPKWREGLKYYKGLYTEIILKKYSLKKTKQLARDAVTCVEISSDDHKILFNS